MRTFDGMCLEPVYKLSPRQIKLLRLREKVSRPALLFKNYTIYNKKVGNWRKAR
jgi:DNA-binding transcriptional regulator YiaG